MDNLVGFYFYVITAQIEGSNRRWNQSHQVEESHLRASSSWKNFQKLETGASARAYGKVCWPTLMMVSSSPMSSVFFLWFINARASVNMSRMTRSGGRGGGWTTNKCWQYLPSPLFFLFIITYSPLGGYYCLSFDTNIRIYMPSIDIVLQQLLLLGFFFFSPAHGKGGEVGEAYVGVSIYTLSYSIVRV